MIHLQEALDCQLRFYRLRWGLFYGSSSLVTACLYGHQYQQSVCYY